LVGRHIMIPGEHNSKRENLKMKLHLLNTCSA
jgi:hypothetical protein